MAALPHEGASTAVTAASSVAVTEGIAGTGGSMRALVSVISLAFTSITFVAPTFADEPPPKPAFVLMDNTGDGSKVNLDLTTIVPIGTGADGVLLRFGFLGQYVAPSGFGGYAGIGASALAAGPSNGGNGAAGDLELGGLYQYAANSEFDFAMRAGFLLPTASDNSIAHLASTLVARPADMSTTYPGATWLRLGISPTYHGGPVFFRADLGMDIAIVDGNGVDPIEHLNLGAGIGHDRVIATAELQTAFVGNRSFHVASLSARYHGTAASPYAALSTLLDEPFRGSFITLATGVTFAF